MADLCCRAVQAEDVPQNVLAQRLGLNPSTITRHLQASRHTHYRNCLAEMTAYLRSQYNNLSLAETTAVTTTKTTAETTAETTMEDK